MRALIIDDDSVIRTQLRTLLVKCGDFEVDCVSRGKIGIDMFHAALEDNELYSIIFVDILLPDIRGPKVVDTIRSLERKNSDRSVKPAKIIMVTVKNTMRDRAESFYNLCDEYMTKPISLNDLRKKLQAVDLIK